MKRGRIQFTKLLSIQNIKKMPHLWILHMHQVEGVKENRVYLKKKIVLKQKLKSTY